MNDDREVFKVRREAGLQKRHEKRLARALERDCNCDMARSEPLDHKPGSHHLPTCPRWVPEETSA